MVNVAPKARLAWIDGVKGISILWIAFFHYYSVRPSEGTPSPLEPVTYFPSYLALCAPSSPAAAALCLLQAFAVGAIRVGFHAVAVFLVLSGFGLTYSLAKSGDPPAGWKSWYRSRVLRLFPMYWAAHLLYLVSPFVSRPEPIDYRFLLSFLGDRVYPIDMIFYYFNPALWYFGLLLELYLVFPVLFRLLQKLGPAAFLLLCAATTFATRYMLLCVTPVNGYYVQGAFFASRLWEFALGMALGAVYRQAAETAEARLFSPLTLFGGIVVYVLGLCSYGTLATYTVTDAFTGTGLFVILAHLARSTSRVRAVESTLARVGVYSYGLYLIHQPYVLYVAGRAAGLPMWAYVFVGLALAAALAAACGALEMYVNRFVDRWLR